MAQGERKERGDVPPLPRDGSVRDLDRTGLGTFATNVRHWLRDEYGIRTQAVYVVGSWAHEEAMVGVSDLDVRVVVNGVPGTETGEEIRDRLKRKMDWTPVDSTFPDVVVSTIAPGEDESAYRIQ